MMDSRLSSCAPPRASLGRRLTLPLLVLLLSTGVPTGCSKESAPSPAAERGHGPPVPVRIAPVLKKTVPVQIRTFGRVEPYATVSVRAQVTGQITRVAFLEGQSVKEGEVLFNIDSQPFEVALKQAEANLARDAVVAKKADLDAVRAERLLEVAVRQAEANLARDAVVAKNADIEALQAARLLEAALKQADASLARNNAIAKNAESEAARAQKLLEDGVYSPQKYDNLRSSADAAAAAVQVDMAVREGVLARQKYDTTRSPAEVAAANLRVSEVSKESAAVQQKYDTSRAAAEVAAAALRVDEAAVENAKLLLSYCTVRAPIDGRAGTILLKQGAIVKANDSDLVVINQIHPIYVTFSVPEQQLPLIRKYMAAGKLEVRAIIPNDEASPPVGEVTFVDNAIDTATSTIRLKATFDNRDERLWPGQFVNVVMTLTNQPDTLVVPTVAVQTSQQGTFVYVVKSDSTVEARPVAVGGAIEEETVIVSGLKAGERVVTDGQLRLVPGSKVEDKSKAERKAPDRPAERARK